MTLPLKLICVRHNVFATDGVGPCFRCEEEAGRAIHCDLTTTTIYTVPVTGPVVLSPPRV